MNPSLFQSLSPALQGVLLSAVFSQPWAVHEGSVVGMFLSGAIRPRAEGENAPVRSSHPNDLQVYETLGVAIQPVRGVIYPGASRMDEAWDGLFNTDRISQACAAVAAMPGIHTLIFQMDTPGGSVYGLDPAAQSILALKETRKDMNCLAYVGHLCASAGMYLAAACDYIAASPGAVVGSIGTIASLTDTSGLWEKLGMKKHIFTADGKLKDMGHGGVAPTQAHLDHMENTVAEYSAEFKSWMKDRRGLKAADMQGQIFEARKAPKGMVDTADCCGIEMLMAAALSL